MDSSDNSVRQTVGSEDGRERGVTNKIKKAPEAVQKEAVSEPAKWEGGRREGRVRKGGENGPGFDILELAQGRGAFLLQTCRRKKPEVWNYYTHPEIANACYRMAPHSNTLLQTSSLTVIMVTMTSRLHFLLFLIRENNTRKYWHKSPDGC